MYFKRIGLLAFLWIAFFYASPVLSQKNFPATPDVLYGELFTQVQMGNVFPDGKTFVDCIPRASPNVIMNAYKLEKGSLNLKTFVEKYFIIPQQAGAITGKMKNDDVVDHINELWPLLTRKPDKTVAGSSLLPLPNEYVVPGGRFREMYYWDSYFTLLGLNESSRVDLMESMINNFAYIINKYGHIPNGCRTYYLSRSQPPFFSLMVDLLAQRKGKQVYKKYLPQLEKEYAYFMNGAKNLAPGQAANYAVKLSDGTVLNRYWDYSDKPRQESYRQDVETADEGLRILRASKNYSDKEWATISNEFRKKIYRHLRAAACSGWDFSNRWFSDQEHLYSIETTNILPVDLNALMLHLEEILATYSLGSKKIIYQQAVTKRSSAFVKYFWNAPLNYFTDYNFLTNKKLPYITAAGMFPFCFLDKKILQDKIVLAAKQLNQNLLNPGGISCTINNTHQQWDNPNGWAPLQWMTIWALEKNGEHELALDIAKRWVLLNKDVYMRTGKLMEKYNVVDLHLDAGGGEYPGQDGFGWTNGVLLALINKYQLK